MTSINQTADISCVNPTQFFIWFQFFILQISRREKWKDNTIAWQIHRISIVLNAQCGCIQISTPHHCAMQTIECGKRLGRHQRYRSPSHHRHPT